LNHRLFDGAYGAPHEFPILLPNGTDR
jgi:hypothetical protein